jgi:ribonuclease HI
MSILAITANYAKASKSVVPNTGRRRTEPRKVKLNVDAAFYLDMGGAILRDYQRQFIAASCKYLPNVASAAMVETMALKEGLALTCRLGCNAVQVESDSTDVTDAFNGTQTRWSESAAIFADCVNLASNIDSITFDHILREGNKVLPPVHIN